MTKPLHVYTHVENVPATSKEIGMLLNNVQVPFKIQWCAYYYQLYWLYSNSRAKTLFSSSYVVTNKFILILYYIFEWVEGWESCWIKKFLCQACLFDKEILDGSALEISWTCMVAQTDSLDF